MSAVSSALAEAVHTRQFLLNTWYVVALSEEVDRTPRAIRVCNEPLVLYRTEDGRVVSMQDRCPHRLAPLSLGHVVGDSIQCAYHGIKFDCSGRCVEIPGDPRTGDRLPRKFDVPSYATQEAYGFVWVWLGDQTLASKAPLPPFTEYLEKPGWERLQGYQSTKANVSLIIDNLLDLSHEAFLHPNTIGNTAVGESPAKITVLDASIEVERLMPDCPPPAMFKNAAGFSGNIDRYQRVVFTPPAFCVVVRATPVAGSEGEPLEWFVHHLLTPQDSTSTHYFFALTRNFAVGNAAITETLTQGTRRTLAEDHVMLEAQQRSLADISLESRRLHTAFDGAPTAGRKLMQQLLAAELS
ncbi:aromatic ring-hydroxylating dioxygenase subunit alpha [Pusillimonas sp.]|uniref:aromatic ring-hydroxylating dioxygenase subunit alpha n=1 Tax=Pusillimonas sp. TaxID=3040095 RepID=UPI00299FFC4F|nr:aromatic ring-hydroxylating dioxygenase subunit alpha [Pusillimonas sp.]MDX3895571.1 aromatic ring-hydroxylating dioxygenase subunit alpha [Pusillimonas sp.]